MIDSPSNPIIKTLRSLDSSKNIREHGLFLVEGVRLMEDAINTGRWPQICLYNRELLGRTGRGLALLSRLEEPGARGHQVAQPLEATVRALEAAGSTQHPQGVVAAFKLLEWGSPKSEGKAGVKPLALVCDEIQDPGNLGTILRTAEASGVNGVWLSPRCADYYNPKVVRAAMGAHFRLPVFEGRNWEQIEAGLAALGIERAGIFGTDARAAVSYDRVDWTKPAALVVSNEAHGLSREAREVVSTGGATVSIPMAGDTESLNASIAAAVILFEAVRQRRAAAQT
jgi:RNA methyltransferase, TrmH family